jgi:hypothetical protein
MDKTDQKRPVTRRRVLIGSAVFAAAAGVGVTGFPVLTVGVGDKPEASVNEGGGSRYVFASDPRAKLDGYSVLPG